MTDGTDNEGTRVKQPHMPGTGLRGHHAVALALALAAAPASFAEDLATSTGAQLYRQFCASCHGAGGHGDGPVAPFFKLQPPDLTQIAKRNGGEFPLERVRRILDGTANLPPHGAREMPVWGIEFAMAADDPATGRQVAQSTITRLAEYLRSMQQAPPR